jgi:arginase
MRIVDIIEAPSNLGLRESEPGIEPGVKKLPEWLKKWGFYDIIRPRRIHLVHPPEYSMELDVASGVRNADKIAYYSQQVEEVITPLIIQKVFPLVIGGDCSILIGPMLGLKSIGAYGLFFLDGHTDYAWPPMSQTGGAAGMDLAIVTGHGHEKLTNIKGLRPYLAEKHAWSVGNRDFDAVYLEAIHSSGIHYFGLPALRRMGLEACVNLFLAMVDEQNLSGFWIHLDVDVLQDELMPAVDSRESDGLTYEELITLLDFLLASDKVVGLDITILDPALDASGAVTIKFINELKPTLDKYLKSGH